MIRDALTKLTIVELVDEIELTYWCTQNLRAKRLPLDRCEDVISRLRSLVKVGKESKVEIAPEFRELLQASLPECIRPKSYILRGTEEAWLNELTSNNILLLSGPSRVGKSNAGRWIAAELEQLGYEVRRTRDLDEVGRFLLAPGDSELRQLRCRKAPFVFLAELDMPRLKRDQFSERQPSAFELEIWLGDL